MKGGKVTGDDEREEWRQTAGEAEPGEEQKTVRDGALLAGLPKALHIPRKIN